MTTLDSIDAYLSDPVGRGSMVLAAAGVELKAWREYVKGREHA